MPEVHLDFHDQILDPRFHWYNPPGGYSVSDGHLTITPDRGTDFWQKTYYGFTPDSGHFLYLEVSGDFVLETRIHYRFSKQFDQGGLMVRTDPEHWIKTAVEYQIEGPASLGAVVTRVESDWSLSDFTGDEIFLRLKRVGDNFGAYFSTDGSTWRMIRLASLPLADPVQAGLFAASPVDGGFAAQFDYLWVLTPEDPSFE